MAEVIGLVASIGSIIEYTTKVVKVIKAAKNAEDDLKTLEAGFESLIFVLDVLKGRLENTSGHESWSKYARRIAESAGTINIIESHVSYEPPKAPKAAKGPLADLYRIVAKLSEKLRPPESGHGWDQFKGKSRKATWFWRKDGFEAILIDVARVQGQVSFILDQDEYELLRSIKSETHKIKSDTHEIREGMRRAEDKKKREKVIQWLSPLDFSTERRLFDNKFPSAQKIIESVEFEQWSKGQRWRLWCYGKPRSGKTVLASFIAEHLQQSAASTKTAVASLFFQVDNPHEPVVQDLLGSLLKQLLQQTQSIYIPDKLAKAADKNVSPTTLLIQAQISDLLGSNELDKAYFILDGWNWCSEDVKKDLEESFEWLSAQSIKLSIMYMTRLVSDALPKGKQIDCNVCGKKNLNLYFKCDICDNGQFDRCLECYEKSPTCKDAAHELKEGAADVFVDVNPRPKLLEEYAKSELNKDLKTAMRQKDLRLNENRTLDRGFGDILLRHPDLSQKIAQAVEEKARGCFLHATLFLKALRDLPNSRQIKGALKSFPVDLDEVYQEAIKRIQQMGDYHRKLGMYTLYFLACTYRPISLQELREGLLMMLQLDDASNAAAIPHPDDQISDSDSDASDKYMEISKNHLLGDTVGLIDIGHHEDVVQLSHESIRYSLTKNTVIIQDKQRDIAILCLDYLAQSFLSKPTDKTEEFESRIGNKPFLAYASQNWTKHLQELQRDTSVQKRAVQILQDDTRIQAIVQAQWYTDSSRDSWDLKNGLNGLHICAKFGLDLLIPALSKSTANINATDRRHQSPLMYACREGHIATIEKLLDLNADVEIVSDLPRTALIEAITSSRWNAMDTLLNRCEKIDINRVIGDLSALSLSACKGDLAIFERLLKHPRIKIDLQNGRGHTSLMFAASNGHFNMVQGLLTTKQAGINLVDNEGRSALYFASQLGYLDITELLLRDGADPDLKDFKGNNACMVAVEAEQFESAKIVLGHLQDLKCRNVNGCEVLHLASEKGSTEMVSMLIDKGADLNAQDEIGLTPLHYAASKGLTGIAKILIENGSSNIVRDKSGNTPEDIAAAHGLTHVVKILRQDTQSPTENTVPIWRLAAEGRLTKTDIDLRKKDIMQTESVTNDSALHRAAAANQAEALRLLLESGGMDPNLVNRDGSTPLLIAADWDHLPAIETLLFFHADPNLADLANNKPLDFAYKYGRLESALALVEAGATVDLPQNDVQYLFFGAVSLGNAKATKILLGYGADLERRHEIGMTARQIAQNNGREELVKLLEEVEDRAKEHRVGADAEEEYFAKDENVEEDLLVKDEAENEDTEVRVLV